MVSFFEFLPNMHKNSQMMITNSVFVYCSISTIMVRCTQQIAHKAKMKGRWLCVIARQKKITSPSQNNRRRLFSEVTVKKMRATWLLYLFLLPAVVYFIVFHYAPLYGIQIAFKEFDPVLGISGSPWVGMKYFNRFFSSPRFSQILTNTVALSLYVLIAGFPAPILLALMLNYTPNVRLRRFAQTVTYCIMKSSTRSKVAPK